MIEKKLTNSDSRPQTISLITQ